MKKHITVDIARSFDDLIKAIAIRFAVYIGESGWSLSEEWDGNDFAGTHMIAYVDGQPAGSIRIRYFGDFAKCERLAVLPQYRGMPRPLLKFAQQALLVEQATRPRPAVQGRW